MNALILMKKIKRINHTQTHSDANNLYGWGVNQYLPTGNFKWINVCIHVMNISDDSKKGYILKVDLEYPKNLHSLHNDLPLPVGKKMNKVNKLIPNLGEKTKYILHYRYLNHCLNFGLKLTEIYRILEFEQSPLMKKYIDLKTQKPKEAVGDFSKDFYKLMYSVFGKTMGNINKRVEVKFVKSKKELGKLANKPNLETIARYSDNLIACHMKKKLYSI